MLRDPVVVSPVVLARAVLEQLHVLGVVVGQPDLLRVRARVRARVRVRM